MELHLTFKLQPASLVLAYIWLVGCSDCYLLFIFFVIILKIFLKKYCLCKYIDYLYIRIKNNNTKK